MSRRKEHLAEMRYVLAHNVTLAEAKRALASTRRRAAEALMRERENRPVISGRELERRRQSSTISDRGFGAVDAPWMMRD